MKKIILFVIIIGGVAFLATGFVKKEKQSQDEGGKIVTTEKVSVVDYVPENYFGAVVRGTDEATVSAQMGGNIAKVYVKEGDFVKRGQLLAIISVPDLNLKVKQAEVGTKIVEEQEKNARRKWDDYKPEIKKEIKLQSEKARLGRDEVQAVLSKTFVRAPFDGVVTRKNVEVGDTIFPGASIFGIARRSNSREVMVDVSVSIGKNVELGDKVKIRTVDGKEFLATVSAISPQVDLQTRKISLRAIFPNNDLVRLGEFVKVGIKAKTLNNVVAVPQNSIVKIYEDNFVFVLQNGKAKMKKIVTRGRIDGKIVVSGIKPEEEVIVSGAHDISDGEIVKVVNKK